MDREVAHYVVEYFGGFMTDAERLAYSRLVWTLKQSGGRSDPDTQAEVFRKRPLPRQDPGQMNGPEALTLAADGYEAFVVRTGERILRDHFGLSIRPWTS